MRDRRVAKQTLTRRPMPARRHLYCGHLILLVALLASGAATADRVVRVGVYDNPPKIYLDREHRISGIFGQLLRRIADKQGWQLEAVPCTWQTCLSMIQSGQLDLMPDVAYSAARAKLMDFGKIPALYSWSEIFRNPKSNISSVRDLKGKRIAVLAASIQSVYLSNLIKSFGFQSTTLVPVTTLPQGFQMAKTGQVDAVATNHFFGDTHAYRYDLEKTPIVFQPIRLFFVTTKDRNADLLGAIDRQLSDWRGNEHSAYYGILDQWHSQPTRNRVPNGIWWGLGGLAVLLASAMLGIYMQRREVAATNRRLQISEDKLAVILDSVDAFIYIKDLQHRYQYVNKRVAELFGLPPQQVIGKTDESFFNAETAHRVRAEDRRVISEGRPITTEDNVLSRDEKFKRSFLTVKQPLFDSSGKTYAVCGISTDFTDFKSAQKQINRLAFYDALTNLPNRTLFRERTEQALVNFARTNSEGALLFIDLDQFKVLNDTLGHSQGDALLCEVANRLNSFVRHNDTLARLGGDEFLLLTQELGTDPELADQALEIIARKVLNSFQEAFQLSNRIHNLTASIGIAMFSDAENSVDTLLKRADMAMYEAKASGRNIIKFYNPQMQATLDKRASIENDLYEALSHSHFFLHYQPLVTSDGLMIGAETLVRWNHPTKGMVSPDDFIPVAELSGQILPLGRWILRNACKQLKQWQDEEIFPDLVVSVNVSARQFHHVSFVSEVLTVLAETGANPHQLELELTESMLAEDIEAMITKMLILKQHGVRFALDDFGTGYSSLSYLKRLPLDQLKIDQSFVRDLLTDPNDAAIVNTILALGDTLELTVIAEGVETEEQRDALIRLGCRCHQGNLFGRPGPASELATSCAVAT